MAVYTWVSNGELDDFLADYDVGRVLSFKGIAEGVENSNYFLQTDRGFFILTLYEKRVQEQDLPFFLGLMNHLAQKGLRVATARLRKDGVLYHRLAGRPAALISFLQGHAATIPSVAQCAQLGAVLAQMHRAADDFPQRRANEMAPPKWPALLASCQDGAEKLQQNLAQTLADDISAVSAQWPQNLPSGIIHADLFCDNVLFDRSTPDAPPGIIDFYFACEDLLAYDLAICLNAWCFSPRAEPLKDKAQAMISHYSQNRQLAPEELAALPLLCRGAALRFLLTRLADWQHFHNNGTNGGTYVRPKDPKEYLRLVQFHKNHRMPI